MSKISTIYDALESLIETTLTTYTKITNAYDPENNNELQFEKAYGIAFDSAEKAVARFLLISSDMASLPFFY